MDKKDIISTMPDDIISNILSRLTIKVVRTSILSTRWRYQWTNFSGVLNFDRSLKTFGLGRKHRVGIVRKCTEFVSKWQVFMGGLEYVLNSLKSPSMQELRICIDMGNPGKIVEWVKFAAEKEVSVLELDFSNHFNETFFEISETIRNVLLLPSINYFQMKSLCVLRLASVDVSGEVVQYFLASCPSLETLFVRELKLLVSLTISGQALRLKHLELVKCKILYLHISIESFITFRCYGNDGTIHFENVPNLVEASFGGEYCSFLQKHMGTTNLFMLISQLNVLKLELSVSDQVRILEGLPEFNNVKHLELQIPHECGGELSRPVSLLSAFPSIFVLKVKFIRSNLKLAELEWTANLKCEYPNLKELEVSGYRGDLSQNELLINIFEKAPNLNKIVVDPLFSYHVDKSPDVKAMIRKWHHETTIWIVDGLKAHVPSSVDLLVL
ncbi:Leucine-rich repeat domain superfamily [Sesbania bispinosa]|nr:Leucine-rich repeat domain superfamily [Sesbania bispinosa]